jgi:hypothetical protein
MFNYVIYSVIFYVIILLLLVSYKPSFIYDSETKTLKEFGTAKNKSLLPLPILSILIAIFIYSVLSCLDNFLTLQKMYETTINKV